MHVNTLFAVPVSAETVHGVLPCPFCGETGGWECQLDGQDGHQVAVTHLACRATLLLAHWLPADDGPDGPHWARVQEGNS